MPTITELTQQLDAELAEVANARDVEHAAMKRADSTKARLANALGLNRKRRSPSNRAANNPVGYDEMLALIQSAGTVRPTALARDLGRTLGQVVHCIYDLVKLGKLERVGRGEYRVASNGVSAHGQ